MHPSSYSNTGPSAPIYSHNRGVFSFDPNAHATTPSLSPRSVMSPVLSPKQRIHPNHYHSHHQSHQNNFYHHSPSNRRQTITANQNHRHAPNRRQTTTARQDNRHSHAHQPRITQMIASRPKTKKKNRHKNHNNNTMSNNTISNNTTTANNYNNNYVIKPKRKTAMHILNNDMNDKHEDINTSAQEVEEDELPAFQPAFIRPRSKTAGHLAHVQKIVVYDTLYAPATVHEPTTNESFLPPPPPPPIKLQKPRHKRNKSKPLNPMPPLSHPAAAIDNLPKNEPALFKRRSSAGTVVVHRHKATFGSEIGVPFTAQKTHTKHESMESFECPLEYIGCMGFDGNIVNLNKHYIEYQQQHLKHIINYFDEKMDAFESSCEKKLDVIQKENEDLKNKVKNLNKKYTKIENELKGMKNKTKYKIEPKAINTLFIPEPDDTPHLKAFSPTESNV